MHIRKFKGKAPTAMPSIQGCHSNFVWSDFWYSWKKTKDGRSKYKYDINNFKDFENTSVPVAPPYLQPLIFPSENGGEKLVFEAAIITTGRNKKVAANFITVLLAI
jgi:hypothetical protein